MTYPATPSLHSGDVAGAKPTSLDEKKILGRKTRGFSRDFCGPAWCLFDVAPEILDGDPAFDGLLESYFKGFSNKI